MREKVLKCLASLLAVLILTACFSVSCDAGEACDTKRPRVLFLSSYDYGWDSIPLQLQGVSDTLEQYADIDYIFMETKKFDYRDVRLRVRTEVREHIRNAGAYDYVLVGDDAALSFALEFREEFFPGIPIIFEGINSKARAYKVAEDDQITGVVETFPIEKTIKVAKSIYPRATKIVGISDNTISGVGSTLQFLDCRESYPDMNFEVLDASTLTREEIGQTVASYGDDTILLFLMLTEDADGNRYTSAESAEYLTSRAAIPIFKSDEIGIGDGILGGVVISYYDMAAAGANMILQNIQGTPMSDIPIELTSSYSLFDKKVMDQFGIKKNKLPGDIKYINDDISFFKKHRIILVPMGSAIITLLLVTIVMNQSGIKRKRLVDEMCRKDFMIANLLENIPGGVVVYRVRGDLIETLYFSDGVPKLTGRTTKEYLEWIRNGLFKDVIFPEDNFRVFRIVKKNTSQGKPINTKFRVLHKDGTIVWLALSGVFIRMEGNARIYYTVLSDISLQVRSEQQENEMRKAAEANKAKTDFLATVSHDMRTPLNGILGLTHLMLGKAENEEMKRDLRQLSNSGRYLLNLINDTLDVSKIESGKLELRPVVCDGKSTIASVLSLLEPNLKEKNIQFVTHIRNISYANVFIDVGRVEQVIVNIIGNAIKFSEEGGRIDFYMENISHENGVLTDRVTVEDHGIGMSKEFLPHFFEPFSRENPGNKTKYSGTGIGMTITRQIIELMGGEISVESEQGVGTSVTFTLPMPIATKEQIDMNNRIREENSKIVDLTGRRALLCEDHPLNAMIVRRMLEGKGMLVQHAENGKIGLQMFLDSPDHCFDVILMDVRMPEMDGLETAEAIRRSDHPQAKTIPMIAMTANAFEEDVKRSFEAGMDVHLAKPVEPQKLYQTIFELLQKEELECKNE